MIRQHDNKCLGLGSLKKIAASIKTILQPLKRRKPAKQVAVVFLNS